MRQNSPQPESPQPPAPPAAGGPGSAPEISARLLRAVLLYFTSTYGRRRLVQLWERERFQVPLAYAETPRNFLPLDFVERLLEVLTEASGDPGFVEKASRRFVVAEAVGVFSQLMRALSPPRSVLRRVVELGATYTRVGVYRIERVGSDDLVVSHTSWVPERQRLLCRARMATFASVPTLWNLPAAQVRELRCQVEGAAACEYHLRWTDLRTGTWRAPLAGVLGGLLAGLGASALELAPLSFALPTLGGAGGLLGGWLRAHGELRGRDLRLLEQQDGLVRSVQDLQQRNEEIFTENVQLEERVAQRTAQLTEANAQLQEALAREQEQYRRRSEFFDNLSHELRTPLTLILLTVETVLAEDAARLPAPVRQHLETLDRSAARLLGVINNLLDLARIESGKARLRYQPVELRSLLASLLLPFRVVAEQKRLSLALVGEAVTPVEVDPAKMESVFQNLVSNALKFTHTGGVSVRVSEDAASVLVEVSDTGPGISEELLPVIFDRFALAESGASLRYKSTGIGLALVKETLELHQAHVEVTSTVGQGTVFRVRLPKGSAHIREELREAPFPLRRTSLELPALGDAPASATAWGLVAGPPDEAQAAGEARPAEGARSLLLVEDDREMRRFLTSILRQHYHVVEAEDGAQGLLLAQLDRPALIVSDVMMPVMSGLEMLQWLRNAPETADIPVILLTARQEVEARVSGLAVGANDYLGKPFSSRELLARIDVQLRLRDAAVRAAQNERLAATGMLTSGFAHEVRNPLNGLINALGPLRESLEPGGDPAVAQQMLALIEDCGGRIHHLAEALLHFVRSESRHAPVDLGELLDSTLHMLGWKLPPDIEVVRHYDFQGSIVADPGELNQVWTNLLDNALRAMNGRGRLTLTTLREGNEAVVRIHDTGEGIPPEVLRRLFEPFFSTRPAGQGTGLGLALSRRIINRYGGRISLRSEPAKGTVCEVRLPAARTAGEDAATKPTAG